MDVLSVMDDSVQVLFDEGAINCASAIKDARAAVAELIEAVDDEMAKSGIPYTYEEYVVAHRRLVKAIKNVKGSE